MIPPPLPFPHTHTHTHTAYRMPSNSPAMTELVGTTRAHAHSCTPPCPTPHKHNSRARPCNAPRAIIYTHPINQNPLSLPPGATQNSAKITPRAYPLPAYHKTSRRVLRYFAGVVCGPRGADERRGLQQVQKHVRQCTDQARDARLGRHLGTNEGRPPPIFPNGLTTDGHNDSGPKSPA